MTIMVYSYFYFYFLVFEKVVYSYWLLVTHESLITSLPIIVQRLFSS